MCLLSSDAVHDTLTRLHSNSLQPPGVSCHCFSQLCFTLIAPSLLCMTVSRTACYNIRWFLLGRVLLSMALYYSRPVTGCYENKWSSTYNGVLVDLVLNLSRRKGPILYKMQMAKEAKFCIALRTKQQHQHACGHFHIYISHIYGESAEILVRKTQAFIVKSLRCLSGHCCINVFRMSWVRVRFSGTMA